MVYGYILVGAGSPDSGYPFKLMMTLTYACHKLVNLYNTTPTFLIVLWSFWRSWIKFQNNKSKLKTEFWQISWYQHDDKILSYKFLDISMIARSSAIRLWTFFWIGPQGPAGLILEVGVYFWWACCFFVFSSIQF